MSVTSRLAGVLLLTSALVSPSLALAQDASSPAGGEPPADAPETDPPPGEEPAGGAPAPSAAERPSQEQVDISVPGAEIVVTGQRERNIAKSSDQVISVLSSADIARTGEGNIAGALSRVTGLSIVGSGFVYVRGLGDRYSLALLNGSPLPSPEPLRRVIPLDIFPSSVVASSLVQKSFSVNYPGEFGGGVINLTTKAVPQEGFFTAEAGVQLDTETTGQLGYTYYGSKSDWTGFDNGERDLPPALQAFFASGERISQGDVDTPAIGAQLVTSRNAVVQKWRNLPPNFSTSLSAGKSWDVDDIELGVIAAAGYRNKWLTRDAVQQRSSNSDLAAIDSDFRRVTTDDRIIVNGLFGLGAEFGQNQLRWTNLYIRDTIKQTRLGLGRKQQPLTEYMQQDTAWFERQLIDTQFVGEFQPAAGLRVDVRGGYANTQREAPDELSLEYVRTNAPSDPFGALFIDTLNGNRGDASITFSDLDEDLWSGGLDVTYLVTPAISATVGGAYSDTDRTSSRREFLFRASEDFVEGAGVLRPDLLLSPGLVQGLRTELIENDEGNPAFDASLRVAAGYGKINAEFAAQVTLDAGVRYEDAKQVVEPIQVFDDPVASTASTRLARDYWLPAATLTWQLRPDMQIRLNASKTVARPQFRELIYQAFFDPDANREYRGNPLLVDSQLYNAEARYEWYFAPEQRLSVAGFYKRLNNPIESFIGGETFITSFANAPQARLYGGELEFQKYFDISGWGGETSWFAGRRILAIGNYTYTSSELQVADDDTVKVFESGVSDPAASVYFRDGAPLTGQSDHLVNLQLGVESSDRLSQQTLLLAYASRRVVSRGLNGSPPQPDVVEEPGVQLDFVMREGFDLPGGQVLELKFEARNLLGEDHEEFQEVGGTRIEVNSYDVGRTFGITATVKF